MWRKKRKKKKRNKKITTNRPQPPKNPQKNPNQAKHTQKKIKTKQKPLTQPKQKKHTQKKTPTQHKPNQDPQQTTTTKKSTHNKTTNGIEPNISWWQFSRELMVRYLVCQNSVPCKSAPCDKWLVLLAYVSCFPHKWISAGSREKCLFYFFYEADDIFSTITHTAAVDKWCFAKCIPCCLVSLFCAVLFPFHSLCNNNKREITKDE